MKKQLIIGLDLSLNSTGICFSYLEDNVGKKLSFYKIIFDSNQNKSGKIFTPQEIKNVNQITYRMPTNVLLSDLLIENNLNDEEQITATLKAMICSKKIVRTIFEQVQRYELTDIFVSFENFIMPAFAGHNQLKTVSALIMLQSFVREKLIMLSADKSINMKITTPSPTTVKKYFTDDGKADKSKMEQCFVDKFNGKKLIPNLEKGKLDDIIDAFALTMYVYSKIIKAEPLKNN